MSILDLFRLDGKVALVTGCRRGIGKSMALALAEAGADIVGVSASLEATDSDVQKEVEAAGSHFRGYACDFCDREALHRFIQQAKTDVPNIDILVKWGIHLLGPHATCCGRTSNSLPRAAGTAPDRLVRRSEAGGRTAVHAPVNAGD